MYGGVFTLIIQGLRHPRVGGLQRVWDVAVESGRTSELFRFDPRIDQVVLLFGELPCDISRILDRRDHLRKLGYRQSKLGCWNVGILKQAGWQNCRTNLFYVRSDSDYALECHSLCSLYPPI